MSGGTPRLRVRAPPCDVRAVRAAPRPAEPPGTRPYCRSRDPHQPPESHLKGPGSARAKRLQNGPFAHWPCSLSSPLALPARANYWSQLHGASGEATQTTDMNSSAVGYTTPTSRQHAAGAAAASLIHTRGGHGAACVALCSRQALATGRSVFLDKTSTFISSHLPPKYRAVDLHGHGCDASARVVRDRLVKKFGS